MDILKVKEVWDYLILNEEKELALAVEEVIYVLEELQDDNYEITIKDHVLSKRDLKDENLVPDTDEEIKVEIDPDGFHSLK
jgi:hypothetical protein